MSTFATDTDTIIDPKAKSGLLLGDKITRLEQAGTFGPDTAGALRDIQEWSYNLESKLRSWKPVFRKLAILDQNGKLIAWIGSRVAGNNSYFGAWFGQLYVGGTGPGSAPLFVDVNGNVIVGQNGSISIRDLGGNEVGWEGVRTDAPKTILSTTNANPDVLTVTAHGYVVGDTLMVAGATGDTAINGYRIVKTVPTANTFTMTNLTGTVIAGNGAYGASSGTATRYFGGAWFQTLAVGGTGFPNAKIRAFADGHVTITNALITLTGSGATITLDPDVGRITVQDAGATLVTKIDSGGLIVGSLIDGTAVFLNPSNGLTVYNSAAAPSSTISPTGGINTIVSYKVGGTVIVNSSRDADFATLKIGGTTVIDGSRNVNAASYSVGGTPGINGTFQVITAFSSGTIQYKDWSGANQTANAYNIVVGNMTVTGGLVTA